MEDRRPARNRKNDKPYCNKLDTHEFICRFLLHILPPGFMKIHFYRFLSHTNKKQALALIRTALHQNPSAAPIEEVAEETSASPVSISPAARNTEANSFATACRVRPRRPEKP